MYINSQPDDKGYQPHIANEAGITLLELLIALAMILIVSAGLSAPMVRSDRRALDRASLQLQADIRYAQQRAVLEGIGYFICFSQFDDIGQGANFYRLGSGLRADRIVFLEEGVVIDRTTSVPDRFTFSSRGTVAGSGSVYLRAGRFENSVTIPPNAGRAAIFRVR